MAQIDDIKSGKEFPQRTFIVRVGVEDERTTNFRGKLQVAAPLDSVFGIASTPLNRLLRTLLVRRMPFPVKETFEKTTALVLFRKRYEIQDPAFGIGLRPPRLPRTHLNGGPASSKPVCNRV